MSDIAMSMCLPHENKPKRLPVIPVVQTALLDLMSDTTYRVTDGTSVRAALTRDVCYPLWIDRVPSSVGVYLKNTGGNLTWNVTGAAGTTILSGIQWDSLTSTGSGTLDGALITAAQAVDSLAIMCDSSRGYGLYIPPFSQLCLSVQAASPTSGTIHVDYVQYSKGDWISGTLGLTASSNLYLFQGTAAGTLLTAGTLVDNDGTVPSGFVILTGMRAGPAPGPITIATPELRFGWTSGGNLFTPSANTTGMLLPAFPSPAEFVNSVVPYARSRTNASAALFTNVTASLYKEGTILASRVKSSLVDFHLFGTADINSVHPSFRYFGPLEKGLYTFTTPSADDLRLTDRLVVMSNTGARNGAIFPVFDPENVGIYNAIVFTDLGSSGASAATQLATSQYNHLEFEATSSLFSPGVSMASMESLHAAEVALVNFGHFHENPIHWAAIAAAAKKALAVVSPLVMPYVQKAAQNIAHKGAVWLMNKATSGDRKMTQSALQPPRPANTRKKPQAKQGKKKRAARK